LMQRLLLAAFLLTVALSPLPLGSNRDWAWNPLAAIVGALLVSFVAFSWHDRGWRQQVTTGWGTLRVPAALYGLVVAWALIQLANWVPQGWTTPISSNGVLEASDARRSIAFDHELQWTALVRLFTYAGVFALATALGRRVTDARRILASIAIVATVTTLYAMAAEAVNGQALVIGRSLWLPHEGFFTGTFYNGNNYATYAGIAALVSLGLAFRLGDQKNRTESPRMRWRRRLSSISGWSGFWFFSAVVCCIGVLFSGSRAGAASLALAMVVFVAAYSRGTPRVALALATLAVMSSIVLLAPGAHRLVAKATSLFAHGGASRESLFGMTIEAILLRPLTGWGMNSFQELYGVFQPLSLTEYYDKAHNTYLELAFDLGLPAAAALVLAVALIVWRCLVGFVTRRRDREFSGLGVFATALAGFHALFDFSLQIPAVACTYSVVLGIAWAQSLSSRERSPE
jgi:O-antigen ligase